MRILNDIIIKIKNLIPIAIKKPIKAGIKSFIYFITEVPPLIINTKRINSLDLDTIVMKKIRRTLFKIAYLKKYDKNKMIADIVGNEVKIDNINRVKSLFVELFVNQPYYFNTSNTSPVIIDCGSHIGLSVIFFKLLYPNAKIIGFEPNEFAFNLLDETVRINNINNVEVHNTAIMNYDGEVDFFINETNKQDVATSTIEERVTNGTKFSVQATKLSHFINDTIDFIKIDIEGAELIVLEELQKSQKLKYIKQMTIEYHHHIDDHEDNLSVLLELLENQGFGYHLDSQFLHPYNPYSFQDIMIFAYNKNLIS